MLFLVLMFSYSFLLEAAQVNFIPKLKAYTCKREQIIENNRLLVTTTLIDNTSHWFIQRKDIYQVQQQGTVFSALWLKRERWNLSDTNPEVVRLEKLLDTVSEKIFQEKKDDSIYLNSLELGKGASIQFDFNESEISGEKDVSKESSSKHKLKKSCIMM